MLSGVFFLLFFFFNQGAQKYNSAYVGSLMVSYTARITDEQNRLLSCGQVQHSHRREERKIVHQSTSFLCLLVTSFHVYLLIFFKICPPHLVNNAGQGLVSVFECIPIDKAQNLFDANFFGVMRVLKAALPGMKARKKGRIINVSSIIGVNGHPFSEIYSASKFALEGLTESLAPTLRKFNIR